MSTETYQQENSKEKISKQSWNGKSKPHIGLWTMKDGFHREGQQGEFLIPRAHFYFIFMSR